MARLKLEQNIEFIDPVIKMEMRMKKLIAIVVILGAFLIGILIGDFSSKLTTEENGSSSLVSEVEFQSRELNSAECTSIKDGTDFMRCLLVKVKQDTNYRKQPFNSAKQNKILKRRLGNRQDNKN